ncbi:MAG: M20/M25/M40 family metallo-hydrolase [Acidaminococcus sp.]|nr:M20/M25/M40 family metallo-hydrolase [Acidaminococcus sp.]
MALTEEDKKYAAHLQRFIQCATVSNANVDKVDWKQFDKLHQAFREFYPHIFADMELDEVGQAGLQFHLKGTGSDKKPLLLMSHQDVVEIGDRSQWSFDPFGGEIIDGCICGRGTTDCKHLLLSELEAVEALLAEGWRPAYDLYLSLGYSEEVYLENDVDGAEKLAGNLERKGVHLGTVVDEGGGLFPSGDKLEARIGLAEKSPVNFEISVRSAGGHSSRPGKGTALGTLAKAIVAIEGHPFPYRLTPLAKAQLAGEASLKTGKEKEIFADPEGHWDELCALARKDARLDALLHTTIAFTMAGASKQPNVLPSLATAQMSVRVLQGDTIESAMEYFKQFLPEGVDIRHVSGRDPLPASDPNGYGVQVAEKVLADLYGGNQVQTVPFLMLGGTDSHYYRNITDNILLFSGHVRDDRWGAAHQVDEKIPVDALRPSVEFFKRFLQVY